MSVSTLIGTEKRYLENSEEKFW